MREPMDNSFVITITVVHFSIEIGACSCTFHIATCYPPLAYIYQPRLSYVYRMKHVSVDIGNRDNIHFVLLMKISVMHIY